MLNNRLLAICWILTILIIIGYFWRDYYRKKQLIDDHLLSASNLMKIGQHYRAEREYQEVKKLDNENQNARIGIRIIELFKMIEGKESPEVFQSEIRQILE